MKQRLILKETECYIPDTTWWKYLSGIKPDPLPALLPKEEFCCNIATD